MAAAALISFETAVMGPRSGARTSPRPGTLTGIRELGNQVTWEARFTARTCGDKRRRPDRSATQRLSWKCAAVSSCTRAVVVDPWGASESSRPIAPRYLVAGLAWKKPHKPRKHKLQKNQPVFNLAAELQRTMGVDLTTIDGIDVMTTQVILSELGPNLSASFPSEDHFASWLELAPRRDVSGGKVIRHQSRKSNNRVANALRMAAQSLWRSHTYLGARYRHLRARLGGQKAVKAMARYLACLVYRLLTKGRAYVDRGAAHFENKRTEREVLVVGSSPS